MRFEQGAFRAGLGQGEGSPAGLSALLKALETSSKRRENDEFLSRLLRRVGIALAVLLVCWLALQVVRSGDGSEGDDVVHCFFLLDRSGSMSGMRSAVVAGFNEYVQKQARLPGAFKLTLAQFDSQQPFEVLLEARDIREVPALKSRQFAPRGTTPLYDAIGALLEHAKLAAAGAAEVVVVVFTDGLENASRRYTQAKVFDRVRERQEAGWTFVFLGANQDSYAAGATLGVARGATSNFVADERGALAAYKDVSKSTASLRKAVRSGRRFKPSEKARFLDLGDRAAERDFEARSTPGRPSRAAAGAAPER